MESGHNISGKLLLVYVSCMPMGFYHPAQIVIDAQKHGVEVRPPDINYSDWGQFVEEKNGKYYAIRLGLFFVFDDEFRRKNCVTRKLRLYS